MKTFPITGIHKNTVQNQINIRNISDTISKQSKSMITTKNIINFAFYQTQGRCLYCGKKLYILRNNKYVLTEDVSNDHLIPVNALGTFDIGNIALSCKQCNKYKGNMSPEDFFNLLHFKNYATLYDTYDEFKKHLQKFYNKYAQRQPMLYKVSQQILNNKAENINVSINIEYNNKGIKNCTQVPLNLDNLNCYNKGMNTHLDMKEIFPNLTTHLLKISQISNKSRKRVFLNAINEVLNHFYKNDIKSIDDIKKLNNTELNQSLEEIIHNNSSSSKAINLVYKYLLIIFDKDLDENNTSLYKQILLKFSKEEIKFI